jgi:hypothetical protein
VNDDWPGFRELRDSYATKPADRDPFIDSDLLPTFNTNAINCFLDRLPGLSRRFIYLEDDMMFAAPVALDHFVDDQNRLRVHNPRLPAMVKKFLEKTYPVKSPFEI